MASREEAAIIFSRKISVVSDSTVASHTEPVQAPAAPIAMQAAICRPVMMPPAASTGTSRIGLIALITSGTSTMVETSPQWPPASVPCTTRISTPAATWRSACSLAPTRAATGTPCFLPISIIAFGGTPSALAISRIGCRNETSSTLQRASARRTAAAGCRRLRVIVQLDAVFLQQAPGEVAVLGRDARFQAFPGDVLFARRRDVLGDQHVEAVGLAVDVIVDPFQLLLDRLRRVRGRAEHAEAAGAADRRHHVAAMAEGQQRKLDAQHLADRRFHGGVHSRRQRFDAALSI